MRKRELDRRTVLEGVVAGSVVVIVGSAAGSARAGLERRCPADEEIAVEPGSTVLFETEGSISGEPYDAEWDGGGEDGSAGGLLVGDYTHATGRPASFRTFESTGTYDVTCAYGGDEVGWTVHVESVGASPPTVDLETDPGAGERAEPDETIEITATATAPDGDLEQLVWIEGRNMTVPEIADLEGGRDVATLTEEYPYWLGAGYSTHAQAVTERGLVSEQASDDGPEIRPPVEVEIVGTNDPVDAGETLEVDAEFTLQDMMAAGDPTQELALIVGHDPETVDTVTVSPDVAPETVTLEFETAQVDNDQEFPVRIEGVNDADERTALVRGGDGSDTGGADVDLSIGRVNDPVDAGETLEVTAVVENAGNEAATRTLELIVGHDPETVDSRSTTVGAGETASVTLTFETALVDNGQEFPVRVETGDASARRSVLVYGRG